MAKIVTSEESLRQGPADAGTVQKPIHLVQDTWHAAFLGGGGAIDVAAAFTNPSAVNADRIPELAASGGATPGTYTITGTWNSTAQVETILTVAGATVKGNLPFDTVTSFQGPDPGGAQSVTLYHGDSYASPPARALYTGAGGTCACQCVGEAAVQTVANLPAGLDWRRRVVRVERSVTNLVGAYLVW